MLDHLNARRLAYRVATALILIPAFGGSTHAQQDPVATFRTTVVVTAERGTDDRDRLPVATSVLTREELESRPIPFLAHAVEALPGFHVVSSHASGLPPASIARGFFGAAEAEYVTVLVDGIPMGDVESGVVDWRRIPSFMIERIEALRGPASAVYGDTALGGVVQVFTVTPSQAAKVDVGGGSFGKATAAVGIGRSLGALAAQVFGTYNRSDGFRDHSGLREGAGSLLLQYARGAHRWTGRGSLNYTSREEPGALAAAELANERTTSDPIFRFDRDSAWRGHAAFRYGVATDRFTSAVLGHVNARMGDRLRTLLLAPGLGDRADRDISSGSAGGSFENSLEGTPLSRVPGRLRFGVDLSRGDFETRYYAVSDDGITGAATAAVTASRWQVAGYATQSLNIGARTTLHAGVRWDALRDRAATTDPRGSHNAWSPRAGAVASLGRGVTAFGQVSRAFKAPTLEQLFDPRPFPDFRGGTFVISAPVLHPQRATNMEGGVRQSSGRIRWEALVYRMRVRDEIDFDPRTFTYANIGRSTHDGAEIDARVSATPAVSIGANYAWMRAVPDGTTRQLKNIPRHLFRPDITVTLPRSVTVHARYSATSGAFADDDNRVPLADRSTIDLRATKRFSNLRVVVDLLNIGNDRYEEVGYVLPDFRGGLAPFYYPAPGFSATGGLEFSF